MEQEKGNHENIKSERPAFDKLHSDDNLKKRKQSDMIIKKGKMMNFGADSKGFSPSKVGNNESKDDPQSS